VRDNLRTLYAAVEHGFAAPLPAFVRDELEAFVDCGVLARGFALLRCENPDCRERELVAFSCKGRGFCPSCLGRRMAESAANLVDHVLPRVPLRQFVLTLPFELRARLAFDAALLGAVNRVFVDSVLGFYRRTLRDVFLAGTGQSGAVTVVQRCSSDLRLNPHFHSLALDGVFVPAADGTVEFHRLPLLSNADVAELLHTIVVRQLALLERRGVIDTTAEPALIDGGGERDRALSALAAASVTGLAPAGPERRKRPPIALRADTSLRFSSALSATQAGFSLHAATTAAADDDAGREALCKYVLRPPIAQDRLRLLDDGLVRIELKRAFSDGTIAVDLDPLSLLCRLATAVPPPRFHVVRYAGVLASAHKWRSLVVPPRPAEDDSDETGKHAHAHDTADERPATHRCRYRPWAELMKRSFAIDVEHCSRCGARLRLRSLVIAAASIERFLRHVGEPFEPPVLAPARDPPFFASRVLRRRLGELDAAPSAQAEMFGA